MRTDETVQQATNQQPKNQEDTIDPVNICRDQLDALQNLRNLISLKAEDPREVRVHLRRMEWHLKILTDTLFRPM